MNLVEKFEQEQLEKLSKGKQLDEFKPGDTVRVNVKIVEGQSERVQAFEGVCIAKKNRGLNSSFTVRKISHGEGVERVFPLFSPRIEGVKLVRSGDVRRAKLYYIRDLAGKAARIREKIDFLGEEFLKSGAAAPQADTAGNQNEQVATEQAAVVEKADKAAKKAAKAERHAAAKKEPKKK